MWQAEIAGGQITPPNELPTIGRRLREFDLMSTDGHYVRLSDYRGHRNLVLVFTDEQHATAELLSELGRRYDEFKNWEAEIIAIAQLTSEQGVCMKGLLTVPYLVLLDADNRIHRQVGATDFQGRPAAAVYVTDRYGELLAVYRTGEAQLLPTVDELLSWLEFVNRQCPECEPPEWPM